MIACSSLFFSLKGISRERFWSFHAWLGLWAFSVNLICHSSLKIGGGGRCRLLLFSALLIFHLSTSIYLSLKIQTLKTLIQPKNKTYLTIKFPIKNQTNILHPLLNSSPKRRSRASKQKPTANRSSGSAGDRLALSFTHPQKSHPDRDRPRVVAGLRWHRPYRLRVQGHW